jgi:cell wall-associated NlpC family hydrolase
LTNGADCSGFVLSILSKYGVSLPHSSSAQSQMGSAVDLDSLLPGDLIFYGNGGSVNHVAMYIGGGQVIHASSARTGIKISNAFYRTPIRARRFLSK